METQDLLAENARLKEVIAGAVKRCRTCGGRGTVPTSAWDEDTQEEVTTGAESCWACEPLREALGES